MNKWHDLLIPFICKKKLRLDKRSNPWQRNLPYGQFIPNHVGLTNPKQKNETILNLRMKYYVQLKRFLAIPNEFKGVAESSENLIFPAIIARNGIRFPHLFRKAEELFERLNKVSNLYMPNGIVHFKYWPNPASFNAMTNIVQNWTV